jgi:LuxR family transcriptional regulator, quorum-sensing system regulator LasR
MHNLNDRELEVAYLHQAASGPLDRFLEQVLSLLRCTSLDELQRRLADITTGLGFDRFLYGVWFSIDGSKKSELVLTNDESSWREKYQREAYARIDPTVSHAVTSLRPLVWVPELFSTEASLNFREEAVHHGLASGVTFPIHGKEGDVALLSFANSVGARMRTGTT